MRIDIRLFAVARQRAGRSSIAIDLRDHTTVADLRIALAGSVPALAEVLPTCMIAVNSEYADDTLAIPPGAEVAVIPPVSGGQDG